jgi:methyl-accepting chemotaxis protein
MVKSQQDPTTTLLKFRLRTVLIVSFVLQISVGLGFVSYLSFQSSQKAVNGLATQLRSEITARIDGELRQYLAIPHSFARLNVANFSDGKVDMVNARNAKQFLTQVKIYPFIYSSYCGDSQGEFLGAQKLFDPGSNIIMAVINAETKYNFYIYAIDQLGNRQQLLQKFKPSDPRKRPWYIAAAEAKRAIWSDIYLDFTTGFPLISAIEPVYDISGKLLGVCGSDLTLFDDLRKFLRSLSIGKTGKAFIIDHNGLILSSSTNEPLTVGKGENAKLVVATESEEPLVRKTAQNLQRQFGRFDQIKQKQQLDYQFQGQKELVQVLPFNDGKGIDWLIVLVIPEADFMEEINANTQVTIWLYLLGLILSFMVAIFTSERISRPLKRITEASEKLANGNFDQYVGASKMVEISRLARSFNKMSMQLKTSFAKLNLIIVEADQVSHQISESTNQIATANKELEETATYQASSTNEVKSTAHKIALTSGQLVKTMDNITQQATATELAASQGQQSLTDMAEAMNQLAQATNSIAFRLGVMNEKANKINSVVVTIAKVADQTNLLSLNAAIEAEKAGEAGIGFAVVAREVRRLADNSASASQEIEEIVKEIQSSVSNGVMEMDKFSQQVNYYVEQVSRVSIQIAEVIKQVQNLTPQFKQISLGMEGQFEGAQQISLAIAQLSEASQETVASLQNTNQALHQLNHTAQELQAVVKTSE